MNVFLNKCSHLEASKMIQQVRCLYPIEDLRSTLTHMEEEKSDFPSCPLAFIIVFIVP